jgi:DNA ligase-1
MTGPYVDAPSEIIIPRLDDFEGLKLAADWIRDLESSDSRIHKEKVIEKAYMAAKLGSANAQCFLFNCYLAYNPYYIYNVKQVPETEGLVDMPNPWPKFWALLEALRTRSISGHAAKRTIEETAELFDSEEWNGLCRRVIIKDLRCGISEKTLNKVLKNSEWKIPVFSCQLATDSNDHQSKMKGRKRLEVKLDGVRVLAVVGAATVLYSRNGKVFENFPQIAQAISNIAHKLKTGYGASGRFVLDGEIVGESFQQLMRQAHRKSDAQTDGMVYNIFDIIPLDDFERGWWNAQQLKRTNWLEKVRPIIESEPGLAVMEGLEVDLDTAEGHDVMRRYAEDAITAGFEGIMIKNIEAPYECKRSSFWMKWKPVMSVDLTVIGVEEGTGRNEGRLGALICEGVDNERHIRVNVGSGLTDSDRDVFWAERNSILGHLVEVQADAVTQNQDGSYSLRFPRFMRFRDFDAGDKL